METTYEDRMILRNLSIRMKKYGKLEHAEVYNKAWHVASYPERYTSVAHTMVDGLLRSIKDYDIDKEHSLVSRLIPDMVESEHWYK